MPSKKPSLSAALREVTGRKPLVSQAAAKSEGPSIDRSPATREGRKVVAGHFDPAVSKQLKLLALEHDTNLQGLLAEAINDLFRKYRKGPNE
jgi:hypothetical protein